MKRYIYLLVICLLPLQAQNRWEKLVDLSGMWKFELGDDTAWIDPQYDDRRWDKIYVPSSWEDEGFPGYDGFAWYRLSFRLEENELPQKGTVYLRLGFIDDCDEVYLNGNFINGSGTFPPDIQTAYNVDRIYAVNREFLNPGGENVLAVRVFDTHLDGGILRGRIGLYRDRAELIPDMDLSGRWLFSIGDFSQWSEPRYDDSNWDTIAVPGFWEGQGYQNYDGFGWYRLRFNIDPALRNERLILVLGKIDDFDEVYLNGERIGRTGNMPDGWNDADLGNTYREDRVYVLPKEAIRHNAENVLAVRVYDGYLDGGIYEGPIGIITRDHYLAWRERSGKKVSIFERLFDVFHHD